MTPLSTKVLFLGDLNTMPPFSWLKHIRRAVCNPRGRITQPRAWYESSSPVFTLFGLLESDDRRVASFLLLIHRCPPLLTLFSFMVQVPVAADDVAQVLQAVDVPALRSSCPPFSYSYSYFYFFQKQNKT